MRNFISFDLENDELITRIDLSVVLRSLVKKTSKQLTDYVILEVLSEAFISAQFFIADYDRSYEIHKLLRKPLRVANLQNISTKS
jgi:Ca2+-binding EF-hand superfamily protein